MPELPEVEALAAYLRERAVGRRVDRIEVAAISALKTYDPPPSRRGRARRDRAPAGTASSSTSSSDGDCTWWCTWPGPAGCTTASAFTSAAPLKPGKGPIALRVRLDDGSGFDLTEAGTQKKLAVYLVARSGRRCRGWRSSGRMRSPSTPRPSPSGCAAAADRSRGCSPIRRCWPGSATPTPTRSCTRRKLSPFALHRPAHRGAARRPVRGDPPGAHRRGDPLGGAAGRRAQGGEALRAGGARPYRAALPGLRRHACARSPSPTAACSTAPAVRPAASRWRIAASRS